MVNQSKCFFLSVEGKTRTIRGCGWIRNTGYTKDRQCYMRTGTKEVENRYMLTIYIARLYFATKLLHTTLFDLFHIKSKQRRKGTVIRP